MKPLTSVQESMLPVSAVSWWTWPCLLRDPAPWAVRSCWGQSCPRAGAGIRECFPARSRLGVQTWTFTYTLASFRGLRLKTWSKVWLLVPLWRQQEFLVSVLAAALVSRPPKAQSYMSHCGRPLPHPASAHRLGPLGTKSGAKDFDSTSSCVHLTNEI